MEPIEEKKFSKKTYAISILPTIPDKWESKRPCAFDAKFLVDIDDGFYLVISFA